MFNLGDNNFFLKSITFILKNSYYPLGIWLCLVIGIVFFQTFISLRISYSESSSLLSKIVQSLTVWDVGHYMTIVRDGYGSNIQTFAFFPLLPIEISIFHYFFGIEIRVASVITSLINLLFFAWIFNLFCKVYFKKEAYFIPILLSLPYSFFFLFPYTESIYVAILFSILYILEEKPRFWQILLIVSTFALSLTRSMGILFIPSMVAFILMEVFLRKLNKNDFVAYAISIFSSVLGFVIYLCIGFIKTGNPFVFVQSQQTWGRESNWAIWKTVFDQIRNMIYSLRNSNRESQINLIFPFGMWLAAIISIIAFGIFIYKTKKLSFLNIFLFVISFLSSLFPLISGSFVSINRYVLAVPVFLIMYVLVIHSISSKDIQIIIQRLLFTINLLFALLFATGGWVG